MALMFIATAYIEEGMYAQAIAASQRAADRSRRTMSHPLGILGYALAKSGDTAQARAVLEMLATSESKYTAPYGIALVYNALGDRDKTFAVARRGSRRATTR